MAQAKRGASNTKLKNARSIISRLRARLKRKNKNSSRMAFGRRRMPRMRFRSPFRRRSYRSNNSGFSRRAPFLGIRVPSLLIWLAIIGGGIFFGKDYIKPLIDKLKSKA